MKTDELSYLTLYLLWGEFSNAPIFGLIKNGEK